MQDDGMVGRVPQEVVVQDLRAMLCGAVRVRLEAGLEAELETVIGADWYERAGGRRDHHGHYPRPLDDGGLHQVVHLFNHAGLDQGVDTILLGRQRIDQSPLVVVGILDLAQPLVHQAEAFAPPKNLADDRRRLCLRIGLGATALFLAAAGLAVALQPAGENAPPILFRLLGQRKYPASALFLLMTLGPTIALLPVAERARGWLADGLATFGRVPMFYYLLHIPLIHLAAMVVSVVRTGAVSPWLFGNHPMAPPELPAGYQWSLPLLYLVFGAVIAILYLPCRWFAALKARRKGGWLTYV